MRLLAALALLGALLAFVQGCSGVCVVQGLSVDCIDPRD